jgi:hypothetical protein
MGGIMRRIMGRDIWWAYKRGVNVGGEYNKGYIRESKWG